MIRYNCRKCRAVLESGKELAGKNDTCPQCGAENAVPEKTQGPKSRYSQGAWVIIYIGGFVFAVLVSLVLPTAGVTLEQRLSGALGTFTGAVCLYAIVCWLVMRPWGVRKRKR